MSPAIEKEILHSEQASRYLLVEKSAEFFGLWQVGGLSDAFLFDFQDILNAYRVIRLKDFEAFLERAQEADYQVVFLDDPAELVDQYKALDRRPDVSLVSPFENAVNGLLPFQVRAYNYLKELDAGLMLLDTGVGKGQISFALTKHFYKDYDHIVYVVKSHNKINIQRDLKEKAGLDSVIIEGPVKKRLELYKQDSKIIITNYEKLKLPPDRPYWQKIFSGSILVWYDEMPNKLKSRNTQLYRAIRNLIYKKQFGDFRSPKIRQYMLTGTPIERSPEDFFNCTRLLAPDLLGSTRDFEAEYVRSYNMFSGRPQSWHKLDKLGLKTAGISYQAYKDDPEIAAQFPQVITQELELDWDDKDRHIYNLLHKEALKIFKSEGLNAIFPLIMLMQLMCNMPSAINVSAENYHLWETEMLKGTHIAKQGSEYAAIFAAAVGQLTNHRHSKLATLKELILEKYPKDKILIFSAFNDLILPSLSGMLETWGVSHVTYRGSEKVKQQAQDTFKSEDTRVFLSSDAGSDSISLEEASVVIHFDLPWSSATRIQRQNRCHRVTSKHDCVRYITLVMSHSVEQRKLAIISKKKNYQDRIFSGTQDQIAFADLKWILGV